MQAASIGKKELIALIGAILILFGVYLYFDSLEATMLFATIICGFVLSIFLVLEKTYYFFLLLIAFIPLSVNLRIIGDAQVNSPSELMLLLLIAVLVFFQSSYSKAFTRFFSHPLGLLLIADIFWQLVTSLTSTHLDVSFKRWGIHTVFIIGFFLSTALLKDPRKMLNSWMAYVIGLVPPMLIAFNNFRHHDFDPRSVFSISEPFFPDHTIYGACIAFILPFLFLLCIHRKKLHWQGWQIIGLYIFTLIALVSVFIALSRAAILSLVVAAIFALLLHWKLRFRWLVVGLVGLGILAISLQSQIYEYVEKNDTVSNDGEVTNHLSSVTNIQTDASNLERVNRWVCAIRMFEDKPWLGYGPGTYQFEYNKFQTVEYKTYISTNTGEKGNAHSEYLTYLSEKGIVGGIIFLLIVFGAIYYGMENHWKLEDPLMRILNLSVLLGLITYFFHGIFNSFMDQSKMAYLYFSALGVIVWLHQYQKNRVSRP